MSGRACEPDGGLGANAYTGGVQDPERVRLLAADPEIARFVDDHAIEELGRLTIPLVRAPRGVLEVPSLFRDPSAFGAYVLDGILVQRLRAAGHSAMRLLGPGEVLLDSVPRDSELVASSPWRANSEVKLGVLGREVLLAARRWPELIPAVYGRLADQMERMAAQLVICQLPRVTDRILGIMWLLAETWGRMTPAGVILPLALTHDTVGALIGARRPTVTLALRELSERGAVVRQDRGWLLLASLEASSGGEEQEAPSLLSAGSGWTPGRLAANPELARLARVELRETVERMRTEFAASSEGMRETIRTAKRTRDRVAQRRALLDRHGGA